MAAAVAPARRPSAGAVPGRWGACLAVRTPPAASIERASNVRRTRVHLLDQQGNRPVQSSAVNPGKESPDGRFAEPFRFKHECDLGLRRVQLFKAMVVMDRQPEEGADPCPIAVRIELGYSPRGLEAVREPHDAR